VNTLTPSPATEVVSLSDALDTPLESISLTQAEAIVRQIVSRQGDGENAVDVARFGSII
jgi:hypothetical protein